jgi:hypothetical protein
MNFNLIKENNSLIAEVISDDVLVYEVQDALDLMANAQYQDASTILIKKEHLAPGFFDLKTGIAGEILQKFSTYGVRVAIIGDFSQYNSKSLSDYIYESNKGNRIFFLSDRKEAIRRLSGR